MLLNRIFCVFITTLFVINTCTCSLGAVTHCVDLFYVNTNGVFAFEHSLQALCTHLLDTKGLNDTNGCLSCNIRSVNGLFELNDTTTMSSVCLGSTSNCNTTYDDGNMTTLVDEFVNMVNTSEKVANATGYNVSVVDVFVEKDQKVSGEGITARIVKQTQSTFTYAISTQFDFPIMCYKSLDYVERELGKGDTYYILKPHTKERVFTEMFNLPVFDCKSYTLVIKCNAVPFQDNVQHYPNINLFFGINHKETTTQCEYIDPITPPSPEPDPPEPDPPEPEPDPPSPDPDPPAPDPPEPDPPAPFIDPDVPQLLTTNPMNNYNTEVSSFAQQSINHQLTVIDSMENSFATEFMSAISLVDKLNLVIRGGKYLSVINCNESSNKRRCRNRKDNFMEEMLEEMDMYFSNRGGIIYSLLSDKANFDYNTKMSFLSMIVLLKNTDILLDNTGEDAINIVNDLLKGVNALLEEINTNTNITRKDDTRTDYTTLITECINKIAILNQQSVVDSDNSDDSDSDDDSDGGGSKGGNSNEMIKHKSIRKAVSVLAAYYVMSNVTEGQNDLFTFYNIPLYKTRSTKLTKERKSFPEIGVDVVIPVDYIQQQATYAYAVSVVVFKKYPLLTTKGLQQFAPFVVAITVFDEEGNENDIEFNADNEDEQVQVEFSKGVIGRDKDRCYIFNYEYDDKPVQMKESGDGQGVVVKCNMKDLDGDVLVGNKGTQTLLGLWILGGVIIGVIGIVGGVYVWKKWKNKKEEKNDNDDDDNNDNNDDDNKKEEFVRNIKDGFNISQISENSYSSTNSREYTING